MNGALISKRHAAPLFLVLLAVVTINSFTLFTLTGLYHTSTGLMGGSADTSVIYDAHGKTPLTSVVPLGLHGLLDIGGVEAVSPEVVAPVTVHGQAVFARGVDPQSFYRMQNLHILSGRRLHIDDTHSAIVGFRASERLNVRVGDRVLALAGFVEQPVELRIEGVFTSGTLLDDELLVPLWVGQWLRGIPQDYVSFIRVRVNSAQLTPEGLHSVVRGAGKPGEAVETPKPEVERGSALELLPLVATRIEAGRYIAEEPEEGLRIFLEEEAGVTETTLWALFAVILAASTLTIYQAVSALIDGSSREIAVVWGLGATGRQLHRAFSMPVALLSIASGVAGYFAGYALTLLLSGRGLLMIASHTVDPGLSVEGFAATLLMVVGASLLSVRFSLSEVFASTVSEAITKEAA